MVVVIGCSRLGASIASLNSEQGVYTSIVDKNDHAFKKLDPSYSGFKIVGDAEDIKTLEKAKIGDATEVVITTDDDNINIYLACFVLKYYDPTDIVVRLHDENKRVLLNDPKITVITPSLLSFYLYKNLWNDDEEDDK